MGRFLINMKSKLHIHSDNSTWSGCENMVGVMLQDPDIHEKFDVSFSFRRTPEYCGGIWEWVPSSFLSKMVGHVHPLDLWITKLLKITNKNKWLRSLLILKYFLMFLTVP